jgi:hypothetical protein
MEMKMGRAIPLFALKSLTSACSSRDYHGPDRMLFKQKRYKAGVRKKFLSPPREGNAALTCKVPERDTIDWTSAAANHFANRQCRTLRIY